jgi:hypothetical protein
MITGKNTVVHFRATFSRIFILFSYFITLPIIFQAYVIIIKKNIQNGTKIKSAVTIQQSKIDNNLAELMSSLNQNECKKCKQASSPILMNSLSARNVYCFALCVNLSSLTQPVSNYHENAALPEIKPDKLTQVKFNNRSENVQNVRADKSDNQQKQADNSQIIRIRVPSNWIQLVLHNT